MKDEVEFCLTTWEKALNGKDDGELIPNNEDVVLQVY